MQDTSDFYYYIIIMCISSYSSTWYLEIKPVVQSSTRIAAAVQMIVAYSVLVQQYSKLDSAWVPPRDQWIHSNRAKVRINDSVEISRSTGIGLYIKVMVNGSVEIISRPTGIGLKVRVSDKVEISAGATAVDKSLEPRVTTVLITYD